MHQVWQQVTLWWAGGDVLMYVMAGVALVLYALIGERGWALFGPESRRARRRDELVRLLTDGANDEQLAWASRYVGLAEQAELTRGLAMIRALTTSLPLLGLLGTVSGMVVTFGGLAHAAGPGSAAVAREASAGIGLALTATQYGMGLAIPGLLAEWLLRRRVDRLVHHRESIVLGLRSAHEGAI